MYMEIENGSFTEVLWPVRDGKSHRHLFMYLPVLSDRHLLLHSPMACQAKLGQVDSRHLEPGTP